MLSLSHTHKSLLRAAALLGCGGVMILQRRHNSLRLSGLSLLGSPSMWSMSNVVLWLFRVVGLVKRESFRVVALTERG